MIVLLKEMKSASIFTFKLTVIQHPMPLNHQKDSRKPHPTSTFCRLCKTKTTSNGKEWLTIWGGSTGTSFLNSSTLTY